MTAPRNLSGHGYNAYTYGCRCDVCRKAKADYMRERRAQGRIEARKFTRGAGGGRPTKHDARIPGATRFVAPNVKHGTRYAYEEHGCRCFPCTDARLASDRVYRHLRSGS